MIGVTDGVGREAPLARRSLRLRKDVEAPDVRHEGRPDAADAEERREVELCCRVCDRRVSETSARFVMTGDSAFCVFANPHGRVFEIQTLSWAEGLILTGPLTREFSWFPGYAWRVAVCDTCLTHLGWRFDASTGGSSPAVFFGLLRAALVERQRRAS